MEKGLEDIIAANGLSLSEDGELLGLIRAFDAYMAARRAAEKFSWEENYPPGSEEAQAIEEYLFRIGELNSLIAELSLEIDNNG